MSTVISPYMNNNYVTKGEFGDFKDDMLDFKLDTEIRFDNIDHSLKELNTFVRDGFDGMERYIDNSFLHFGEKMDDKFEKNKIEIITMLEGKLDQKLDQKLEKAKEEIVEVLDGKFNQRLENIKGEIVAAINNK